MEILKKISFTAVLLYLSIGAFAQDTVSVQEERVPKFEINKKNAVDLSVGGTGLFVSANYNRIVWAQPDYFMASSVGFGSIPIIGGFCFPHQLTVNIPQNKYFWEFGLGGSYWNGKSNSSGFTETIHSYHLSPIVGYRQQMDKLVFRAYINPLIRISGEYLLEDNAVLPYLGVSLGYCF